MATFLISFHVPGVMALTKSIFKNSHSLKKKKSKYEQLCIYKTDIAAKAKRKATAMVSYVSALLYGVGGIVVAGMALLVAFQEKLVYVPVLPGLTKSYQITPARLRLMYEDVWLRSSDGVRLHSWFIKFCPDCRGPIPVF